MANQIPHAVLSGVLEDRIDGRRVVAAVFLTFEFDPGFFEQEILPVILDVPVSHARGLRLVQLEDALRSCAGRIAVYYDADRLVAGDAGSGHLDVERVPVRHKQGYVFHPKNVLLLLEKENASGERSRSLLVGALSANLTRAGWWENIEAAHFEEVEEGESTRLKDDLQDLLRKLKSRTAKGLEHGAVEELLTFLQRTDQRINRVSQGSFHPHFHSGLESLGDFLERCAGGHLSGCYLEVISPFFDNADKCAPLEDLLRRFSPKEVRVMLPRSRDGTVACSLELYESVRTLPNVRWGKLVGGGLKLEFSAGGNARFVHAKLYRFFTQRPKREFCFVGSFNLTRAAHLKGGNWETGLLVEAECPQMPDFWLEPVESHRFVFKHEQEAEPARAGGTPLMLRYHWDSNLAEAFWNANDISPALTLEARGQPLGRLEPMNPAQWHSLEASWADGLAAALKETSFVKVHGHGDQPGLLLVQEDGMSHKPSVLFTLSVAEILRYWAMLTPAQRIAFLEAKAPDMAAGDEGAALLARFKVNLGGDTFFDRFAGYFHSFNCLERDVREQLSKGRLKEANYRIFGRKYDSLGTLLRQSVADNNGLTDDVSRYVVLLCARQLCNELARDHPDYWKTRREDVDGLEADLDRSAEIRARLAAKSAGMPAFLDWFDMWFLKRAQPLEVST